MQVGIVVGPKHSAHFVQSALKRAGARAVFGTKVVGLPSMWTRHYIVSTVPLSTKNIEVMLDKQIPAGFQIPGTRDDRLALAV